MASTWIIRREPTLFTLVLLVGAMMLFGSVFWLAAIGSTGGCRLVARLSRLHHRGRALEPSRVIPQGRLPRAMFVGAVALVLIGAALGLDSDVGGRKGYTKDNCRFVCGDDPDGLVVDTLDGQHFLVLNGVQTMSSTVQCLLADVPELMAAGVSSFRLSPQVCDMVSVSRVFRDVIEGRLDAIEGFERPRGVCKGAKFSNGFLHALPVHLLEFPRTPLPT